LSGAKQRKDCGKQCFAENHHLLETLSYDEFIIASLVAMNRVPSAYLGHQASEQGQALEHQQCLQLPRASSHLLTRNFHAKSGRIFGGASETVHGATLKRGLAMIDVELLSEVPLFSSLDSEGFLELAKMLVPKEYRRNEVIFHQGDPGSALHIIETGQVKIVGFSEQGNEVIFAILVDNDCFGELSLFDGEERSATAISMIPTCTLSLHRDDFLKITTRYPGVAVHAMSLLSKRLRQADSLIKDAAFLSLSSRLAKRLISLGEQFGKRTDEGLVIDLHVTQQDLADALGASRVAVNKQLGLYQDRGFIRLQGKRIILLHPDELIKLSR